jgi:hypothetical protein
MTEDQERESFEKACVIKFAIWRVAGNTANDNGAPATREALCWRDEHGNYGVMALQAAWWGWKSRAALDSGDLEARELLLRACDAIQALDGTTVENERLVDDYNAWLRA